MTESTFPIEESPDFLPEPSQSGTAEPRLALGRFAAFGLIITAILLMVTVVAGATWGYFLGVRNWLAWQILPGSLAVAFVATMILAFRFSNPLLRTVQTLSASWLGALNFAFFAAMASWISAGVFWLAGWPVSRGAIGTFWFGLALVTAGYGLINASWIRVTRVTVALRNLPEAWRGRTVALLTDLHLGPLSGPGFLRRILVRLRSLRPDAVLISGDMFDGSPIGLDRLVAPWDNYSAPQGIFYVTGNHDEFAERSLYLNAVSRTGIRVLNNEKVSVDGLQIVGVHDSEAMDPDALRSILRGAQLDPLRPSILLAHQPANLAVAEEEGISLKLSGHTHGGQMWPWNGLVSRIYGPFAYGLHRLGKLLVYTSSGVGTWGPPLRVATKSEIVLIRLETESASS